MADKGAHFFRCDLQVHTPRDINWSGNAFGADDERLAYARTLVQACRDKDLQGIAVTDHHDMLFASIVRRAAAEGCVPRFVEKERRPPLRHQGIRSGGNLRVFENLAQTLVAVDAP